jgi:3',5'-cyclic AMP phosphodiesterase CpdA
MMPISVRIAHYSDVHITSRRLGWRWRDTLGKRVGGIINLRLLGRGYRFRQAAAVAATLLHDVIERKPDHVVFSGDATTMAFDSEMTEAAAALGVGRDDMPPGLAVPGNHDYYTLVSALTGTFEQHFAPWQTGQRIDGAKYPFAQQVGPIWLIGVNSASHNFWMWDASGRVGYHQMRRLERLLAELPPGPRVLVTHYPARLEGHRQEIRWRKLHDCDELIRVAAAGGVGLWLHGHRHRTYFVPPSPEVPFPMLCAGSATQNNLWGYNEYVMTTESVEVHRRVFSPASGRFEDQTRFTVPLGQVPSLT